MHRDFFYEFSGFGSCPSRCHIRMLNETGKPVVVIVSQVKKRSGTSVMNAYEIIGRHVYGYLAKQRTERLKADTAD